MRGSPRRIGGRVAGVDDVKDRDVIFHKKWLGLAQPIEGLVFSVPVLADAQIAPEVSIELSTAFDAQLAREIPRPTSASGASPRSSAPSWATTRPACSRAQRPAR